MIFIIKTKPRNIIFIPKHFCRFVSFFSKDGQTIGERGLDQLNHRYLPPALKKIEAEWKPLIDKYWKNVLQKGSASKSSRYILAMFPYPSGSMHLGHVRIYTSSDIMFRMSHLRGFQSIHPMGFDSFGLPAENAAKLHGIGAKDWTENNVKQMRQQLNEMGFQFNWREKTSDPTFYKWTQWLFLQLYKSGLAYKAMGVVNWDPIDRTVLADEQVDSEGRSWRSGAKVEKRCHKQWFIKTNAFADQLYNAKDIENSGHWSEILLSQKNYLKKPSGYLFYLKLAKSGDTIQLFTKYPELFSHEKAFVAVSSTHWLAQKGPIEDQIVNPFTNKPMDIRVVINQNMPESTQSTILVMRESFEDTNVRQNILNLAKELNVGGYYTSSTYRDWLISRQRHWGTPIPMIYCDNCGVQPVPEDQLPVISPELTHFKPPADDSDQISDPIMNSAPKEWLLTECPKCHSSARRETETCDTFFDSSWYFMRYASDPHNDKPFEPSSLVPTFCYVGGKEHAVLHLLYSRFMTHFLHQKGFCHFREPFQRLLMQSVVKGKTYKLNGRYISAEEAKNDDKVVVEYEKMSKSKGNGVNPQDLVDKYGADATRWTLLSDGTKKERLWGSEEKELGETLVFLHRVLITVEEYREIKSGETKINGHSVKELDAADIEAAKEELLRSRNETIDKVVFNVEYAYSMSNMTIAIFQLIKTMRKYCKTNVMRTAEYEKCMAALLVMISPFVPHFAAECWQGFASHAFVSNDYDITKDVFEQKWPQIDDPSFQHLLCFTYTDPKGRHVVSKKTKVSRSELKDWTESDVINVVKGLNVSEEDIEKIEIIRDVVAIVRLKYALKWLDRKDKKVSVN